MPQPDKACAPGPARTWIGSFSWYPMPFTARPDKSSTPEFWDRWLPAGREQSKQARAQFDRINPRLQFFELSDS